MGTTARTGPNPSETRKARTRYDRIARAYDLLNWVGERFRYREWRPLLWERAPAGRVLEVGIGTGANGPYYPESVRVLGVDLSWRMLVQAAERPAPEVGRPPTLVQMDAQALGFGDETFDAAVGTFVFCSVTDPLTGLVETRRALKPGGRLLLLEHVRSPRPVVGRLMDWLNPVAVRTMGVNINRDTVEEVRRAGFRISDDRSLGAGGIFRLIEAIRPDRESPEGHGRDPNQEA